MPLQRSRVHVNGMPLLSYQNNLLHFLSFQCVQRYIVMAREGGPCQTHYFIYNGFFVSAGNDKTYVGSFSFPQVHQTTLNSPMLRWLMKCLILAKLSGVGRSSRRAYIEQHFASSSALYMGSDAYKSKLF